MKYLGVILCLLIVAKTNAQDALPPATFMGIEINGSIDEFSNKLKKKGFKLVDAVEGGQLLRGNFAGESAKIFVGGKENVYSVFVLFEDQANWVPLESKYFNYKNRLISKYGEPLTEKENFYGDMVDGLEMYKIDKGEINYISTFRQIKSSGLVSLSISKSPLKYLSGCVSILYADEKNTNAKRKDDNDDL